MWLSDISVRRPVFATVLSLMLLAFGLPILLLLFSQGRGLAVFGALLATVSMAIGLVIERWLFFAEAEHVSMLYYGADAA